MLFNSVSLLGRCDGNVPHLDSDALLLNLSELRRQSVFLPFKPESSHDRTKNEQNPSSIFLHPRFALIGDVAVGVLIGGKDFFAA
jgi:hypothetical protein